MYLVPNFGPSDKAIIIKQLLQGGRFNINGQNYYGVTENIDSLWYGTSNLTYAVNNINSSFANSPQRSGFVQMSSLMVTFANAAFELWDDVIGISLTPAAGNDANMALNFSTSMSLVAFASTVGVLNTSTTPPLDISLTDSEIWVNANAAEHNANDDYFWGSRALSNFLHEIGHSLGLQHGGDYDAGEQGPITYANDAEYVKDTNRYTVMSYFAANADGSGTDHVGSNGQISWAATPLINDIFVLQAVYGADTTTRTSNTVYGFNSTANCDAFDFTKNINPVIAIWDAGGIDTLDASGFSTNQNISLIDGTFSSVGHLTDNVAIAYNAIIENGVGGTGNDSIAGNTVSNTLDGRDGNDHIFGGSGADTLIGGNGTDQLNGQDGNDIVFGDAGDDVIAGNAGIDYLSGGLGIDQINGGSDADEIYGGDGNDTLTGGDGFVTDIIVGGDGNDVIYGNSGLGDYDRLNGAAGNDIYYVDTPDDLTFEGANEGTDIVYANILNAGFYLYAHTENLVLQGVTPFGVGNELANQLTGNGIDNYLLGGAAADVLNGMGGNDVLFGEAGADRFVFTRTAGGQVGDDVIGDFAAGVDKIDLSGLASGFTSFAHLQSSMSQVGADLAIDLGLGDIIVLHNVNMPQLTAVDFII